MYFPEIEINGEKLPVNEIPEKKLSAYFEEFYEKCDKHSIGCLCRICMDFISIGEERNRRLILKAEKK